jgi:hypothetical protein
VKQIPAGTWQGRLSLPYIKMANDSESEQFRNFDARAIVDQGIKYTIVGGRFSPTRNIDLTHQVVTLSIAGANDFRLSVSADSFRKTGLGGYVVRDVRTSFNTDLLLQPFSGGDWAYSAGIEGFVPGSTLVTVSVRIGNQAGSAKVEVFTF